MNIIKQTPKAVLFLKRKGPKGLLLLIFSKAWRTIGESYFWNHSLFATVAISIFSASVKITDFLSARKLVPYTHKPYTKSQIQNFTDSFPESHSTIIFTCDHLVHNNLYISPIGQIDISTDSVWLTDLLTNKIYPNTPKQHFHKELVPEQGDPRLLWELNRLQFLITLAQGYVLTRNGDYLETANRIIDTWANQNKYCHGVNWTDSQEVGIRMTSILIAQMLFEASGVSIKTHTTVTQLLRQHSDFILFNLSLGRATHNHLLTELASLQIYSLINKHDDPFVNLKRTLSGWLLKNEINKQLDREGISREQSTNYTFFVYDAILLANYFYRITYGKNLVQKNILINISNVITEFSVGENDFVKIGDADCGRHSRLSWHSNLSRLGFTSIIKGLFLNLDARTYSEELFWLSPESCLTHQNRNCVHPPSHNPCLFKDSGFLTFNTNNRKLYIRLGPTNIDPDVRFGHAHSDYLSFSIYVNEMPVFIDPGTKTYLGPDGNRTELRSASHHNTATIDNREFLDIATFRFGIPELFPVSISDLVAHGQYYSLDASFKYNKIGLIRRIFVFDKILDIFAIINIAQSSDHKTLTERYILSRKFKTHNFHEHSIELPGNNKGSINFLNDDNYSSTVNKQIIEYAPRYATTANGTLINRVTPLLNGNATTYTIIRLTNNAPQAEDFLQTLISLAEK